MINKLGLIRNAIISQQVSIGQYTILNSVLLDGGQFIDTNVIPDVNTTMEIKCQSNIEETMFACGSRVSYGNSMFCLANNPPGQGYLFQMGTVTKDSKERLPSFKPTDFVELSLSKQDSTINNISLVTTFPSFTSNLSIFLGACNQGGAAEGRNFKGIISRFKVLKNNTLTKDFVPVIVNKTGEIGFLETVENKFYPNEGTGEFKDGKVGLWVYPDSIYMDIDGNFTLSSIETLYPSWSYNEENGNIILTHSEETNPEIRMDSYGNIIIQKEA